LEPTGAPWSRAVLLVLCLSACGGEDPSGPPPESVAAIVTDPYPRVLLPPTVELRPQLEIHDSTGARLPLPVRTAFEWTSDNPSVATVSGDGVIRVRGSAAPGARAEIHIVYGAAETWLTVFAAEPPVEAKVVPEYTATPGAQLLLYGRAVTSQGVEEEGHLTAFTLLEGSSSVRISRVGCVPAGSECIGTAPDMAWLFAEAPGQAVIRAEIDGLVATGTVTIRTVAFASVTAGSSHTCGVTTDDVLFCWGGPFQSSTPIEVSRPGYTQIQAANETTCGLDPEGVARCWALRGDTVPRPVSATLEFTRLSVGTLVSCGLEASGKAWCWGENGSGQLGNGLKSSSAAPVPVAGGLTFTDIAASSRHTCGLVAGGAAYCWGTNADGVLGDTTALADHCGIAPCSTTPIPAAEGHAFVQIVVGDGYSCGRTGEGALRCWGSPAHIGVTPSGPPGTAELIGGGMVWTSVAGGAGHACAIRQDGAGFCWGDNGSGQTGQAAGTLAQVPTPIGGDRSYTSIDVGSSHTCGLTDNGLYCWGDNSAGQLGVLELTGSGHARVTGQE
jgi:alpha-tubulin suppressor-like RCC1 family protein